MTKLLRRRAGVPICLGLLLTLGLSGSSVSNAQQPTPGTAARGGGSYLNEKIPTKILNLKLFDGSGKVFTLGSLKGKNIVISNFLTSCHETCPMTTANLRDLGIAVAKAGLSNTISVLELSVDGARDTAPRIAAYQKLYNDSSWTIASGSVANLASVWEYFGAPAMKEEYTVAQLKENPLDWYTGKPNTFDMSHSNLVIIVGADSNWKWLDLGAPKSNGVIPAKLKAFLSRDGIKNLAKPEEPTWSNKAVLSALTDLTGAKF
ncbi:MAG: SCO family protein [Actinomycetales bacterium]|nr:MAG: SCO family protein [Actinomycetales bacterium]